MSPSVTPDIGARARDVFSRNTPEEIFSDRRIQIQHEILNTVQQHLRETFNPKPGAQVDFIRLEDVLIRGITLPKEVEAAINRKEEQKQLNLEYDYRLLREAKESERKRVEAQGIKEFQDIISSGITDSYLRWKGIEATLELSRSPNAKIVVIGGGKGGLPIILGNMDGSKDAVREGTDENNPDLGVQSQDQFLHLPSPGGDSGNAPPARKMGDGGNASKPGATPSASTPGSSATMTTSPPGSLPPDAQPSPTKTKPAPSKQ